MRRSWSLDALGFLVESFVSGPLVPPTQVSSATGFRQGVAGCGISLRRRSPELLKVPWLR